MSRWEKSGERDLTMSRWHRRVFGDECSAYDQDLTGMCGRCDGHLYVWEVTRADVKSTRWTQATAIRLNAPGYLIQYQGTPEHLDWLRAYIVWPRPRRLIGEERDFRLHLERLRSAHEAVLHAAAAPIVLRGA